MMISVLTRIPSGTIFDKIGTKKSNLALKTMSFQMKILKRFIVKAWHQIGTKTSASKNPYLMRVFDSKIALALF